VHIDTICKEIMISEATFYRLIRALREKFGAVIECKKYVYRLVKKAEFPERYYE
jgi:predicted DNA-binding transcriptional regulator AlpA